MILNFKNRKTKSTSFEDIEPHEVLLDKLAKKKEEELGISEKKLETPISLRVFKLFFLFSFLIFFILFFRALQLNIVEGENWKKLSQENKFIINKIKAERGVIYDRNLNQLVFNRLSFDLICNKNRLPSQNDEREKILNEVSQILKIKLEEIKKIIFENPESIVSVFKNLDFQTLIILETKIKELPGFEILENPIREYPFGEETSHLIGYLGKITQEELNEEPKYYSIFDNIGREGIEKSYERILRKNPGELKIERDAKGNIISKKIISNPTPGKSLVLYLDLDLQKKITEELKKKIKEIRAKGGAAVVLDPNSGGVMALVSLPSFDNNLFSKGIPQLEWEKLQKDPLKPLLNRATSGQYLLGSTIKPFIAIAALEENIISPQKKINCQGQIEVPHQYNPEIIYTFKDWTIHGPTDIRKAIAESCNVFFYTIGGGYKEQKGLGPSKIKKYLDLFGLGKIPQIDLFVPEWARGNLPDPEWKKKTLGESWVDGDTYNLSIGQGYILATPLQIAVAYSAIANGGKLLAPRVVQKIVDSEKNIIEEIPSKVINENFINPQNIEIVKEGMRWAVTGQNSPQASAIALNDLPVTVAAKTGTAQVFRKDCQNCYNIWISLFAPYENPKIVLTIVLEDVPGRLSQVVVPVAKEILNWYFQNNK